MLSSVKTGNVVILREYLGSKNMVIYFSELALNLNEELKVEKYDHDFNLFVLTTFNSKKIMVSKEVADFIYVEIKK